MRANNILIMALLVAVSGCFNEEKKLEGAAKFRYAKVGRSDLVSTVEATGTVTPRNTSKGIPVGAQVNGKVIKLFVDYNSVVTNGQVVALIDPLVYEADYKSALAQLRVNRANVGVRKATVKSCEAELVLAEKTYARKKALADKSMAPIADLDSAVEALAKAQASLESARASLESVIGAVEESEALVVKRRADLDYCTIRSPVNGIVIDRKVEEGETVVSSYNAVPVLTIAEDLKVIWVEATVPEADVGNIKEGQTATFTADAYRRKFTGKVKQVRRASTTTSNVVTYPIIIEAENPNEMLFPGMTATLSIETARASNAVVISTAAFRFRPKDEDRPEMELPKGRRLWFADSEGKITPRVVKTGVSDGSDTQILENDELEGREVVVGYAAKVGAKSGDTTNPFMPKHPQHNKNKGTAPEPKK